MKRRFEYRDEKSDKYWEYERLDECANVTWGRIGSTGQTQVVDLATAEKRAREKLGKGYVEVTRTKATRDKIESDIKRERARQIEKQIENFPTPQEEHPPEDRHEDMWDELIRNIKAK